MQPVRSPRVKRHRSTSGYVTNLADSFAAQISGAAGTQWIYRTKNKMTKKRQLLLGSYSTRVSNVCSIFPIGAQWCLYHRPPKIQWRIQITGKRQLSWGLSSFHSTWQSWQLYLHHSPPPTQTHTYTHTPTSNCPSPITACTEPRRESKLWLTFAHRGECHQHHTAWERKWTKHVAHSK